MRGVHCWSTLLRRVWGATGGVGQALKTRPATLRRDIPTKILGGGAEKMTQRNRPSGRATGAGGNSEVERELERTTQMRGFRYGLHDFVAAVGGAETLKRHNDNTQSRYLKESKIDRKTKELLIVVACMASRDLVSHMQIHMHAAHKAGASPEEIMEAIDLVSGWTGNVAKIPALEAWRATFRPDIPTIDRVVELR